MLDLKKYTVIGFSRVDREVFHFRVKGYDAAHAVREAYWEAVYHYDEAFGMQFVVVSVVAGHVDMAADERGYAEVLDDTTRHIFRIAKACSASEVYAWYPDDIPCEDDPSYWPGEELTWDPTWIYKFSLPHKEEDGEARHCLAPWRKEEEAEFDEAEKLLAQCGPAQLIKNMHRHNARHYEGYCQDSLEELEEVYCPNSPQALAEYWKGDGMPVGPCPFCDRELTANDLFDEDGLVSSCPEFQGTL